MWVRTYQKNVTEISILSTGNYMRKAIHKSYFVWELLRYKETNMQRNFLLLWFFHCVNPVIKTWKYHPESIFFFLQKHLSLVKSKKIVLYDAFSHITWIKVWSSSLFHIVLKHKMKLDFHVIWCRFFLPLWIAPSKGASSIF